MKKYPLQFLENLEGRENNTIGAAIHWLSMNVDDEIKV
jgi:hypothetical protein